MTLNNPAPPLLTRPLIVLPHSRFPGIDALLYVSFLLIVCIHCWSESSGISLAGMIDHMTRFGIPVLLIAGGFFMGRRHIEQPSDTEGMLIDLSIWLAPMFAFWVLFYVVITGGAASLTHPVFVLKALYSGAPSFHMWLLPALWISGAGIILARGIGWEPLFIVAACLYIAGLVFLPYATLLGLPTYDMRSGPFFAFFFVLAGYCIAREDIVVTAETALAIAAGGLIVQLMEAYVINMLNRGDFVPYDFLLGSTLFGTGMFLLARTLDDVDVVRDIAPLGRLVMGMFCAYPFFLRVLGVYFDINDPWQAASIALLTIAGTTALVVGLVQVPWVRRLVT